MLRAALPLACAAAAAAFAQTAPPVRSPQVNPDRTVTIRFRDPNAHRVSVLLEGETVARPMRQDAAGVWTVTLGPLAPEEYGYSLVADGVMMLDPNDALVKPNLYGPQSAVLVPGAPPRPWEFTAVPHGAVGHRFYHSDIVGDNRDFYVYTPPGYNPSRGTRYPVLYLLHGFSDDAGGWISEGRANFILDNLIAQRAVRPMVVVMPLGYGEPRILERGFAAFDRPALVRRNLEQFRRSLLAEVMPLVASEYRVKTDANDTAIAGLSMGGAEALYSGLNDLDRFAWIGSFSGAVVARDYSPLYPGLSAAAARHLRLLWIACGADDTLLPANRRFRSWLDQIGIRHTDIQAPGRHTWLVWRDNLVHFLPLLFRKK